MQDQLNLREKYMYNINATDITRFFTDIHPIP